MLQGKVGQAMKFINNDSMVKGVHPLTRTATVKGVLQDKHPAGVNAPKEAMLDISSPEPQPVVFEVVDADAVYNAAKDISGAGGPTHIDADGWKHILCHKFYGKSSRLLCDAITDLAKKLSGEAVDPNLLSEFIACRLILLDKGCDMAGNIGVRPIGIREVLRRIIGKVVVGVLKNDIQEAAGPLQTFTGLKFGIEACIHATKEI
jgi:hypothetical protein